MKEINISLLVIGDITCTSYVACHQYEHLITGWNLIDIKADNVPDYVDFYGKRYHLKNAIVIDLNGKELKAVSFFAPNGKSVFATGKITALCVPNE